MDLTQSKEQFSHAYVRAVASVAGYAVYKPEVDDDSVDLGLAARGRGDTIRSPRLELQLKCTAQDVLRSEHVSLELGRKNFEDLRGTDLLVPRILVIVVVPVRPDTWIVQTEDSLAMRRCGYWLSLRSYTDTENVTSVTVQIPRVNVFSVDNLRDLMALVGRGEAP